MGKLLDPALDEFRLPPDGKCWWCGAVETTREHKFKASDLRRVATTDGVRDLSALHKWSDFHNGPLRTLKRGDEVQWGLNMCAPCNNARSQPFDMAYDRFVSFLRSNAGALWRRDSLDWAEVYGPDWATGSARLARYFVKQFACMMATQHLPVPDDAVAFLDGDARSRSIKLELWRDHRLIKMAKKELRAGDPDGMIISFMGLPPSHARHDGFRLTGAGYQYRMAYMVFDVAWRDGQDLPSFHEQQLIPLPIINARVRDRLAWLKVEAQGLAARARQRREKPGT